jgi:hypothetical protein
MADAYSLPMREEGLAVVFNRLMEEAGVTDTERWQVSKYGATGDQARQEKGSELWAECTAARIMGKWDLVPPKIQAAYDETLAKITKGHAEMKAQGMEDRAVREARRAQEQANKAVLSSLRKRLGLDDG